jgi:hypothetical protein
MPGVHAIDPSIIFCSNKVTCVLRDKDMLLYADENHLSPAGAMSLEPLFRPIFRQIRVSDVVNK